MNPIVRQGLIAPAIVAAVAVVAWLLGGAGAALVVLAIGAAAIIGFHLLHLQRISDWAVRRVDAEVPEGRGVWAPLFASIYRRASDSERRTSATCGTSSSASSRRPPRIPDGIVVLDAANRIDWANPRALAQLGLDLAARSRPADRQSRAAAGIPPLPRGRRLRGVHRRAVESAMRARPLALQLVPFAADQKLLHVARRHRARSSRADAPRLHRQRVARAQDAAHRHQRLHRDAAGHRRRRAAAQALPATDARAGEEHAAAGRRPAHAFGARKRPESRARRAVRRRAAAARAVGGREGHCRKASIRSRSTSAKRRRFAAAATSSRARSAISSAMRSAIRRRRGRSRSAWRVDADGTGVFAVTDTGIGIAAEYLPRLTERFYRVDRSRSRATGGTGLGLAIVKHVLLRHQAELEIESERGKGSTFAVRLPANRVQHASPAGDIPSQLEAAASLSRPASARPRAHDR